MDSNGNQIYWREHSFLHPSPRSSFFVPTVLLEERARTFQAHEDQSAAEYVEYLEAFKKLLANYHTTVWTLAADAALALATSATQASAAVAVAAPLEGAEAQA